MSRDDNIKNKKHQSTSLPDEIKSYYGLGKEAGRLTTAAGELEFERTKEIITRYLPNPPAVIIDIGGGPGAYACWLARKGFKVCLLDPILLHLEQAIEASWEQPGTPISSIAQGEASNLPYPDLSADLVLLLGPLYHLTNRSDRIKALREAYRVLIPNGHLIAVGISRFASTLSGLIDGYFSDPDFVQIVERDLTHGQHRNPTGKPGYFTTSYFHHPDELKEETREAGFLTEKVLAVEGSAVFLQDLDQQWRLSKTREQILEAVRWLEEEPSVIGVTGHVAAIGIKPE